MEQDERQNERQRPKRAKPQQRNSRAAQAAEQRRQDRRERERLEALREKQKRKAKKALNKPTRAVNMFLKKKVWDFLQNFSATRDKNNPPDLIPKIILPWKVMPMP